MSDELPSSPGPQPPVAAAPRKRSRKWRLILLVVGLLLVVFVIIPRIYHAWHTVSTDDAYVNSYVTFVAPRVSGQVARVAVEDNNQVKKGDLLVELDTEPYR